MLFLAPIDLNTQELRRAAVQNLSAAPGAPARGQIYFDTVLGNHLYVYNGTAWEQASGVAGGGGTVTSVGLSIVSQPWLTVANSPVTGSGVLTVSPTAGQPANSFVATPSGSAGVVGLRTIAPLDVPTLDAIRMPAADVSINSHKVTNLLDPVNPQDGATKNYVDAAIQGTPTKPAAQMATTAALPANTYNTPAATLTGSVNGALPNQDGQVPTQGNLILVHNEGTAANNGLYTITTLGSGGTPYVLTRHPDMDSSAEFGGALVAVENGTLYGNSLWMCTTNNPTVGSSAIAFTQLNKQTAISGTPGQIVVSANTISIDPAYVGQTSITTLGVVGAGLWQGSVVGVSYGGTGASTPAGARSNIQAAGKYQSLIGNGSLTTITIPRSTHLLAADQSLFVAVYDATNKNQVHPDVLVDPASGDVSLVFATAPTSNQYRVVLIG